MSDYNPEKIIEYMWDMIPKNAQAQGDFVALDKYTNSLMAQLMKKSGETSIAAQEREAKAHSEYIKHCYALGEAKTLAEKYKWQLELARMKFDAWRTMEASCRQIDRMVK